MVPKLLTPQSSRGANPLSQVYARSFPSPPRRFVSLVPRDGDAALTHTLQFVQVALVCVFSRRARKHHCPFLVAQQPSSCSNSAQVGK